jgi:hypothetical protein
MYCPASADVGARPLRAARANRGFGTDEKHIRTKTAVMDKSPGAPAWLFSRIAGYVGS